MEKEPITPKKAPSHLKPAWKKGESGNPKGRPIGTRNYKTIYKEALTKIANSKGQTPEEIEDDMVKAGLIHAIKGNYNFYRDVMERIHGKVPQATDITSNGESIQPVLVEIINAKPETTNDSDTE